MTPNPCVIRDLDPASGAEVDLVARRMRETLVEVEGEEAGTALYAMDWLRERVRWHLDPANCAGRVLVSTDAAGAITGHAIVREEKDESGRVFGLFSTVFVDPPLRRAGIASRLVDEGEAWMRARRLREAATWTSSTNAKLIALLVRRGYGITAHHVHEVTGTVMVRLARPLA